VIGQSGQPLTQYAFQTKAGDLRLPDWMQIRGQIDVMRTNSLAHPDFDTALPREGVLVLTGRLIGGAPLEAQNYKDQIPKGQPAFDIWDRERLLELLTVSPDVGLSGFSDGPLLELLGRIDQGRVTESAIERFSERWIGGTDGIEWRALLESAIVANRLRLAERLDLACFTALAVIRAIWASVHGAEPPSETTLAQRDAAQAMFVNYASEIWARRSPDLLDPKKSIHDELGILVTYPVQCSRLIEMLALYGLAVPAERENVAEWLRRFVESQPGAAHPISDRWAVSLLPCVILLGQLHREACSPFLTEVLRWMGNQHDNDGLGLAGPHAEPLEEVEYLLGASLDHIDRPVRRHTYLAAVLLDVAALLEDDELYDLAYNEVAALDIRPFLAVPRDDVSQYMATGHGIDVPMNTSPGFAEFFAEGRGWRMADHHDDDLERYYLGRIGRLWDHVALSVVTRDRHWVAGLRKLLDSGTAMSGTDV
jgi:hypothetical protein